MARSRTLGSDRLARSQGMPWDLRPTGVPEPEVDVEAQPGVAEAEGRERRWQRPRERPRDETHQGGVRVKRVRFDEPSSAPASASDAAEDDGIQSKRIEGKTLEGENSI